MVGFTNFYILIISLFFYKTSITKVVKRHNYQFFSPVIYKHKWITRETKFPLRLETPVKIDADFKWFKTSEDLFIEELENYDKEYDFEQGNGKLTLDILKYNHIDHEQLSSYEPRVIGTRTEKIQEKEIFSLFYLKSHKIEIINAKGKNKAFCNVTILLPQDSSLILNRNQALILQNLILKFGTRIKRDVSKSLRKTNIRFKRHGGKLFAIEYVEGPIYFTDYFFSRSEEVKCQLQLWENSRIVFQDTISKKIDLNSKYNSALSNSNTNYKLLYFINHYILIKIILI